MGFALTGMAVLVLYIALWGFRQYFGEDVRMSTLADSPAGKSDSKENTNTRIYVLFACGKLARIYHLAPYIVKHVGRAT